MEHGECVPEPQTLTVRELTWNCPADWVPFDTTDELGLRENLLGQDRAVAAIRLGLRIQARGYNIYVSGAPGTGRTSSVRRLLQREAAEGPSPDDLVYVQNFVDPRRPRLLRLPTGRGRTFKEALAQLVTRHREGLAALRSSGSHRQRRERAASALRDEQARLVAGFQQELTREGLALVEIAAGSLRRHELAILIDERPVPFEELPALVQDKRVTADAAAALRIRHPQLEAQLSQLTGRVRELSQEIDRVLAETDRAAALPFVEDAIAELRRRIGLEPAANRALDAHLESLREFLLQVLVDRFASGEPIPSSSPGETVIDPLAALDARILVDRSGQVGRPVVEENNPSPARLAGLVEPPRPTESLAAPDLGRIRAGSLHQADGGFLILSAQELLSDEAAWPILRRTLRSGELELPAADGGDHVASLDPEPASIDTTVVLIGSPTLREALVQADEEFHRLFKITAQFDDRVPLDREHVDIFSRFLKMVVDDERLPAFRSAAVARLIEHMVRIAERRDRLSTRFRLLADLAREAAWFAREAGRTVVERDDVVSALGARRDRSGLLSQRVHQSIHDGLLLLELEGERTGQVNALAVVETTLERFGYPMRVTATTAVGRAGIIDIEREAELSGEIHTKASLILAGYLRSRFAQHHPLAITASICFEQSYGGVEGDSASAAELAAVLSSLGGAPIRQDLAVTGAVDQRGQILPVGGINEKIEGFWEVCSRRGLTGTQGVVIPAASKAALQLDGALIDDVLGGRFHVYAVSDVTALIGLLTGRRLGEPGRGGAWEEGTLGAHISLRINEMAEALRGYGNAE